MSNLEKFEKWADEANFDVERAKWRTFKDAYTQFAWEAWQAASLVEREACAKSCEQQVRHAGDPVTFYAALGQRAAAIRARGDA